MSWHGRFIDLEEVKPYKFAPYTRYTWELLKCGQMVLIKPLEVRMNEVIDVFKGNKKIGTKTIKGRRYVELPNSHGIVMRQEDFARKFSQRKFRYITKKGERITRLY